MSRSREARALEHRRGSAQRVAEGLALRLGASLLQVTWVAWRRLASGAGRRRAVTGQVGGLLLARGADQSGLLLPATFAAWWRVCLEGRLEVYEAELGLLEERLEDTGAMHVKELQHRRTAFEGLLRVRRARIQRLLAYWCREWGLSAAGVCFRAWQKLIYEARTMEEIDAAAERFVDMHRRELLGVDRRQSKDLRRLCLLRWRGWLALRKSHTRLLLRTAWSYSRL